MSYDVSLYRVETKANEQKSDSEDFFDNESNLEPFMQRQKTDLRNRLLKYDYAPQQQYEFGERFYNQEEETFALLTDRGLFFTAGWNEDSIFEIRMTASEFTDTGEFAKYDPQNGGWEDGWEE